MITSQIKIRGEENLANWIAQNLAQKAPREWDEYQDWLHDILLDRLSNARSRLSSLESENDNILEISRFLFDC